MSRLKKGGMIMTEIKNKTDFLKLHQKDNVAVAFACNHERDTAYI